MQTTASRNRAKPSTSSRKTQRASHQKRPKVRGAIHVVQRIRRGLPNLRTPRTLRVLERAFRAGKEREGFALVHYSIQEDHLHLVIAAQNKKTLARGMQGLAIRVAKALNRKWNRRGRGSVFAERYFARALEGYRQVWRALRYVLNNGRKHGTWTQKDRADPFSSGRWFFHRRHQNIRRPLRSPPIAEPCVDGLTFMTAAEICLSVNDRPGPRHYPESETLESMLAR